MRAVAGLVAVQVALRATLCLAEGENVCSLETGLCTCEEEAEEKRTRCEGLKPIFESAGSHCVHYNSDSASCEAEENHGYCEWKGVMVENVVQGKCVTSVCWLKFQHTLAACPEFWPNITMIGPNSWGSDSGEVCSGNCALHFASFYKDEVCMEWLDDMTLCDRWRLRPPLHGGCQPKPHMREDMEHLSAHCIEQAENEDILDMFIFIVVLGLFAALCGHFIARQTRKSEKLEMEDIMLEQGKADRSNTDESVTGESRAELE